MYYVEAFSDKHYSQINPQWDCPVLFLAGGITGCGDWQSEVVDKLSSKLGNVAVVNPRRSNYPDFDPMETVAQIEWEFLHLKLATHVLFWFPKETLCPITLFEYGRALADKTQEIYIGCDPEYRRLIDLIHQTRLERPDVKINLSIEALINEVLDGRLGK